jgi:hypothetical protein
MADAESIRQIARSRAPLSTWLGIVLLFGLFGVIVFAVIGPMPRGSDYEEARAKKRIDALKALREETNKSLTTYDWIDKNKGVARIPIARAMELTVAELSRQKPAPAGPIATPEVQATPGAPTTPAPASPAPAGSPATQGAAVSSPLPPGAVSPSPAAAQPSPSAPASPSPTKSP